MQWAMQLGLVDEQRHPHVAGNTGCCSSDDHTKGAKWGEANIDALVEQCEREETRTRPWSVLSVVEKGPTPVFDNDMEFAGRAEANEVAEARVQRGRGRIVGLQDASRSRLFWHALGSAAPKQPWWIHITAIAAHHVAAIRVLGCSES